MKRLLILFLILNISIAYAECGCAKVNLVNQDIEQGAEEMQQQDQQEVQQQVDTMPLAVDEKVVESKASPITGAAVTEVYQGKDDIVYFVPVILFFIALNIIFYLKRKKN